jgi:hypothetical protein
MIATEIAAMSSQVQDPSHSSQMNGSGQLSNGAPGQFASMYKFYSLTIQSWISH